MSGMLHPVGPEPARTYWIRRGILAVVAVLLALGVVFAVANLTKAAVATAPPPAVLPADSPSPSTGSDEATSPASPGGSPSPVTSGATPSASTSARPSPSVTGAVSAPASAPPSTDPTTSTTASASPRPSAKPTTTTVGTPDCKPTELRVTIKGDRSLDPGQRNTFTLSLSNAGKQTCLTSVTDRNFELKVYSGKDRIWSSRDCSKTLVDFDKRLAARADVDWRMTWNGERSVKGAKCQYGSDTPRAGTYWATAQLEGAEPVQLRMIIS